MKKIITKLNFYCSEISLILKFSNHRFFKKDYLEKGILNHEELVDKKYQDKIIKRIIEAYHKSKEQKIPKGYALGGEWEFIFKKDYSNLIKALNSKNSEDLKIIFLNFCRKSSKGLAMSSEFERLINKPIFRYFYLANFSRNYEIWKRFFSKNLRELDFKRVGNPFGLKIENSLIPLCAFEQDYYAEKVNFLVRGIKKPVVCEIGGGFGWMSYYLLKKNKSIKYINFDLPEIIAIASYFLMMCFPKESFRLYGEKNSNQRIMLFPNFELKNLRDNSVDVVFNSNSFPEMDDFTFREYINQIKRICRRYFYHSNHDDENVYNNESEKKHLKMSDLSVEGFKKNYQIPMPFNPKFYSEYLFEKITKQKC